VNYAALKADLEALKGPQNYKARIAYFRGLIEISDADLEDRIDRIEHVVVRGGELWPVVTSYHPREDPCLWDIEVETTPRAGLKILDEVVTVHSYGAPSLFKPSAAECLAQIPEPLLSRVKAFSVVGAGFTPHGSDCHVGLMTLYTTGEESMGNRSNLMMVFNDDQHMFFYSHWLGTDNAVRLHTALSRQKRWTDEAYLARIIFCELVKGYEDQETGFGIAPYMPDNGNPVVVVDLQHGTVTFETSNPVSWTFQEYIELSPDEILDFLSDR
jgi:hypothetical protein